MKKLTLLLLSLIVFTNVLFADNEPEGITVSRVSDGYLVTFKLPGLIERTISAEGEEFTNLLIPGYGTTSEGGFPALPLVSFNLAVPYSSEKVDFEIITKSSDEIFLQNKVFPFQEPWSKNKPIADRPFNIDRAYYSTDGKVLPFVQVSESFILGGVKGVRIIIQPINYNPSKNRLELVREGIVKIKIPASGEINAHRSQFYNNYLNEIFVNYSSDAGSKGINYLIITAPEFETGLTPFVAHKTSMGYTVDVFNTGATGTTTTSIKSFIQQRYNNQVTKPEFVLLVGDVDKIPAWTGTGAGTPKTDLNYACLEGSDFYSDVFVGRFSVTSATQLQNAINKTVYMENYIATVAKKNIFMASTDNYTISEGTHNYVINTYFGPNGYTNLKLYTYTYGATTSQLTAALNDNQMFAVYSGHGSTTSWADGPVFTQSNVNALTNTVYPFVYSFACITGDYSYSECFGETWLRTSTGASSFYGSSVNSYWDEDDILERNLFKAMFVDDITKVTPMFDKGKIYFVNYYGSVTSTVLRYLEMYNLMGDPSLETVRHIPPDSTAPAQITDLAMLNPTSNSLTLNWTAPYDSTIGGVVAYDIRYSTSLITEENFVSAPGKIFSGQSDTAGVPKAFTLDSLNYSTVYYTAVKGMDMWGNASPISNVVSYSTLSAPVIAVQPDSLSLVMTPDSTRIETIFISNICSTPSTLDYTVELANNTFPGKIETKLVPVIPKEEVYNIQELEKNSPETSGMSIKGHGGPDAFGYKWKDSNEPGGPQYVWNSITGTGTQITNWIATGSVDPRDDGYAGPFNIGFNFKFYGEIKTQLYVHTNGLIVFAPVNGGWISNYNIPNSSDPNAFAAPFWDDLDGKIQGTVHYKQETDKFIIQFTNWQKYGATASSFTFQIVLSKSGRITYYYNNLVGDLNSCTVGIEGPGGTTGLPVTYNASYLANNKAIQFAAEPEWVFMNSTAGTITSGNTTDFLLQITSDGLDLGAYSMDVIIKSNCQANPLITIPIHLTVTNDVPVELVSFTAENAGGEVLMQWQTRTETNNQGFRIERKYAENPWNEIGFIKGSGTTAETSSYSFKDKPGANGTYKYRLTQIDFDGTKSVSNEVSVEIKGPDFYELSQNYPNPFNPATVIRYSLPVKSSVRLVVLNVLGEVIEVLSGNIQESGYYEYTWNASGYSSGIYFCSMQAAAADGNKTFNSIKKMILIK